MIRRVLLFLLGGVFEYRLEEGKKVIWENRRVRYRGGEYEVSEEELARAFSGAEITPKEVDELVRKGVIKGTDRGVYKIGARCGIRWRRRQKTGR